MSENVSDKENSNVVLLRELSGFLEYQKKGFGNKELIEKLDAIEKRLENLESALNELTSVKAQVDVKRGENVDKMFPQNQNQPSPSTTEATSYSKIDLDGLGWKEYRNGKGEWIFAHKQDGSPSDSEYVRQLCVELKEKGAVNLFGYVYKFSGKDDVFIARSKL